MRKNKYGAKRTCPAWSKQAFASKGEAERATQLHFLRLAGEISDLHFQKKVNVIDGLDWKVDFQYTEKGTVWIEDFKGVEDARFKIIKKLWPIHGTYPLKITKKVNGRIKVAEMIWPEKVVSESIKGVCLLGIRDKMRKNVKAGKGTMVPPDVAVRFLELITRAEG
jgi:hypothetical protein